MRVKEVFRRRSIAAGGDRLRLTYEAIDARQKVGLVLSDRQTKEQFRRLETIDRLWEARDLAAMWGDDKGGWE